MIGPALKEACTAAWRGPEDVAHHVGRLGSLCARAGSCPASLARDSAWPARVCAALTAASRSCRRSPVLLRGPLDLRNPPLDGHRLPLGGSLSRHRLGQLRIGLLRRRARLGRIGLGVIGPGVL